MLIPPEWTAEIVASMATPVLDTIRRAPLGSHLDSKWCTFPFPIVVDANVPDPDVIYQHMGYELTFVERRIVVTHHLKPVLKLERG